MATGEAGTSGSGGSATRTDVYALLKGATEASELRERLEAVGSVVENEDRAGNALQKALEEKDQECSRLEMALDVAKEEVGKEEKLKA